MNKPATKQKWMYRHLINEAAFWCVSAGQWTNKLCATRYSDRERIEIDITTGLGVRVMPEFGTWVFGA